MAQGPKYKKGHGEVVAGVRRGKAGVGGAIIRDKTDAVGNQGVSAGPEPENMVFDEPAADKIADDDGHSQISGPDPALFAKIEGTKHQQKEVKWDPKPGLPHKEEDRIQKRVGPIPVDVGKEAIVTL